MIAETLLKILVCPENHQPVTVADNERVAALNKAIADGKVTNRAGKPVTEAIDGGLVRADGKFLYPIRRQIPIMLVDEAIAL